MNKKTGGIIALILAVQLFLLANLQFTAWPEMLSYPYLKNSGFALYKDMIHPYPPILTTILGGLYKIFGYRLEVLQFFTWGLSLLSTVVIYALVKTLTKKEWTALSGATTYAIFQPHLEGNMMWFDNAMVTPVLAGLLFTIHFLDKKKTQYLVLAGICLSFAGFIKQTGGLFYLATFLFLLFQKPKLKDLALYLATPFIFAAPLFLNLLLNNAVMGFLNWVVFYPTLYWSKFPNYVQLSVSKSTLLTIGLLTLTPLSLLLKNKGIKDKKTLLLGLFMLVGLIGIYPRFSFFHFQPALGIAIAAIGYALGSVKKTWGIMFISSLVLLAVHTSYKQQIEWGKEPRFLEKAEYGFAKDLQKQAPSGKLFLQGIHSGSYALSGTLPPKPWGDNFAWYFEIPGVQEDFIEKWKQNPPEAVVWKTPDPGNWHDLGTYQPAKIVNWISENYTPDKELRPGIWVWRRRTFATSTGEQLVVSEVEP
jgi:hypothetical protein